MKFFEILVLITVLCWFSECTIWWKREGHDPGRSGFNRNENVLSRESVKDLTVKWKIPTQCTVNRQVIVYQKYLFYGGYCGEFKCIDRETTDVVWESKIETTHTGTALNEGVVFVGARCTYGNCGNLYAYKYNTGELRWTWHQPNQQVSIAVLSEKNVYVTSNGQLHFHAVDKKNGSLLWSVQPGGYAAFDKKHKIVVISGGVQAITGLHARNEDDGSIVWSGKFDEEKANTSMPCISEKFVFVHSDAKILAFEKEKCMKQSEEYGRKKCEYSWKGFTKQQQRPYNPPPSFDDEHVYVGSGDTLFAFPIECSNDVCDPVWKTELDCNFFDCLNPPSIANGVVYVTCDSDYIYALDSKNGKILWRYFTHGGYELRSSPTISDGVLYHVATFDFNIYAFDTKKKV